MQLKKKSFSYLLIAVFGSIISGFVLHYVQVSWLKDWCNGPEKTDLPNSCHFVTLRLYIMPIVLSVILSAFSVLWWYQSSFLKTLNWLKTKTALLLKWQPHTSTQQGIVTLTCVFLPCIALISIFKERLGFKILHPMYTAWLGEGDPAQMYLGSLLFRTEPWHFPLGRMEGLLQPFGTNVAFTDPIPILVFALKILNKYIPIEAQFFGIWLLLCYIAFGVISGIWARQFKIPVVAQCCASLLFGIFPPLFARMPHFALNAMWIFPASFLLIFSTQKFITINKLQTTNTFQLPPSRPLWVHGLLVFFTAWIHPYLTVMIFVPLTVHVLLFVPVSLKNLKFLKLSQIQFPMIFIVTIGTAVILSWYIIGYIGTGVPSATSSSYPHYFTANLNTFWNSLGTSEFLKSRPMATGGQYEGFGYVGFGILMLSFFTLARHGKYTFKWLQNNYPHFCTIFLIALILAQGCLISFEKLHFELPIPVYGTLLSPFRSIGRFIWLSSWLITFFAVAFNVQKTSSIKTSFLVLCTLVLQIWDLHELWNPIAQPNTELKQRFDISPWKPWLTDISEIQAIPAMDTRIAVTDDYRLFWWMRYLTGVKVNVGSFARYDTDAAKTQTENITHNLATLQLVPHVLYVFADGFKLPQQQDTKIKCGKINVYGVCRISD